MKKLVAMVLLAISSISFAADTFVAGQILVSPKAGLPDAEFKKILGNNSGKHLGNNVHLINVPAGTEKAEVASLKGNKHIKFAELNMKVKPVFVPNDYYFSQEWHLTSMNVSPAWDTTQGSGIIIAILDTGVRGTHQDLVTNMVPGYNFYVGNTDTHDVYGHGTAVAGTAAAITNNGLGVSGIAGQAKIMPMVIADSTGWGTYSSMYSSLLWAADNGARVANISYGGVPTSTSLQSASQYMKNKGGLVTVAAANEGKDPLYPDTDTMVIVSAIGPNGLRTSWSNYGVFVDVTAPGDSVLTTSWSSDSTYSWAAGTSFSAPATAGVIALIMAANPALSANQVQDILFTTARDIGDPGKDIYYGWGVPDATSAVAKAKLTSAVDTIVPVVNFVSPLSGTTVSGIISITASASDNIGVHDVTVKYDGVLLGSDMSAPYSFSWDTNTVQNGNHTLSATATDSSGNVTTTNISVTVANPDSTPPVINILSPQDGATITGNYNIQVSTTDKNTITQSLLIDGVQKVSTTSNSMSFRLNTKKVASGAHTIEVRAKDSSNNAVTKMITVYVK